jgi:hypothetical protein
VEEAKKRGTTTEKWMLISDLFVANLVDIDGLRGISQVKMNDVHQKFVFTMRIIISHRQQNLPLQS